jgi:hypothetical protein
LGQSNFGLSGHEHKGKGIVMNESEKNDSPKFAQERLLEACRTKDRSKRWAWTSLIGTTVLLVMMGLAFVDYRVMLAWPIRLAGATLLATLLAFGLFRLRKFWRRPTRFKEAALDVEAQRPELGCEVSTAAEYLAGERQSTHDYEPELVAALESKAAEHLRNAKLPYRKRIQISTWLLTGAVVCLLLFIAFTPAAFIALTRTAFPFLQTHYAHLEVKPGNVEIPVGSDLEVTNIFSGRLPTVARFHWQEEGKPEWQNVALIRKSDGVYLHPLKNLRSDLKYRVTGSDAVSDDYEIRTYVPPEVRDLSIQISYPDYTRHAFVLQQSPDINVLRGSTAGFQITPSVKLSKAVLRFSAAPSVELENKGDNLWTGNMTITKDTDYWIELTDAKGHRGVNEKAHHIKAVPDAAPRVEITEPGQDLRSEATNTISVKISVADDFGVDEIKLIYHKLGGPEQEIYGKRESETNGEIVARAELPLEGLGLKEYDVVAYHAEAKDNNNLDGPGLGKSAVYFIEITNEAGGPSKAQGKGQAVNLLVIQKQIIADTTAIAASAPAEKFNDLSARQRDAVDFGKLYHDSMSAGGAPPESVSEMQAAIQDMEQASSLLGNRNRQDALPPEESALAHFYQVLKLMPKLEDLPTTPKTEKQKPATNEMVAVVLEAIKKKKEQQQPDEQEIAQALEEAKELRDAQANMNSALQTPGQAAGQGEAQAGKMVAREQENQKNPASKDAAAGKGKKPEASLAKQGEGEGKSKKGEDEAKNPEENVAKKGEEEKKPGENLAQQRDGEGKKPGENLAKQGEGEGKKPGQNMAKQGEGDGKKPGEGKGKQGQGQGKQPGEGKQGEQEEAPVDDQEKKDSVQMAEKQNQLSKEAAALAEKLQRLAGKDRRVGHNTGQNARQAAGKMEAAAESLKEGNFGAAGAQGMQGERALDQVIAQLERLLKTEVDLTDVASEEAPKEYEALISEYLKKLSYAE